MAGVASFDKPRHIAQRLLGKAQMEGPASIRRIIGGSELSYFDPIIIFDWFSVKKGAGFIDHPHRGFEVVSYMLKGASSHEDFAGHKGSIKSGDVQWMTAGRGIVHSEWPSGEGDNIGVVLWINLSSKNKMMEPRYQEIESHNISRVEKDGVEVKIIAGESMGVRSPIFTATPMMFLDFTLHPGARVEQNIPEAFNACILVLEGEGHVSGTDGSGEAPVGSQQAVVLGSGDGVVVRNESAEAALRFLLVGGDPVKEPAVKRGNFVMRNEEEIAQAYEDYRSCINGFEKAKYWKSSNVKN